MELERRIVGAVAALEAAKGSAHTMGTLMAIMEHMMRHNQDIAFAMMERAEGVPLQ
jgi:hypothetical protein